MTNSTRTHHSARWHAEAITAATAEAERLHSAAKAARLLGNEFRAERLAKEAAEMYAEGDDAIAAAIADGYDYDDIAAAL